MTTENAEEMGQKRKQGQQYYFKFRKTQNIRNIK